MKRVITATLAALLVTIAATDAQVNGTATISGTAFGSPLTVSTSSQFAGAISSIVWNGKEFINDWDHGRQLAVNAQFFNRSNCYNPYEAGSFFDANLPSTSSNLLEFTASANQLESRAQMAWYLHTFASTVAGDYCGDPSQWLPCPGCTPNAPDGGFGGPPNNGNFTSLFEVHKKVTIGFAGLPNVIEYLADVKLPEQVVRGATNITAVMPWDFSSLWAWDAVSKEYRNVRAYNGVDDHIKVVSTADGNYAFGFYAPELLQPYNETNGTMNWWRLIPPDPNYKDPKNPSQLDPGYPCVHIGSSDNYPTGSSGEYKYSRAYMVIGNLNQVKDTLTQVHFQFRYLDPEVYNWRDYMSLNGLQFATQRDAENHWLTQGIAQGLRASKTFSASQYLQLNPASGSSYQAAIDDYVATGRAQGKGTTARPAIGMQHAAVVANGKVSAVGENSFAQLGNGSTDAGSLSIPAGLDQGVTEIAAGDYTSFAVKSDGTLWVWGSNQYGARGDGSVGGNITTPTQVPIPVRIATPSRVGQHSIAVGNACYAVVDDQGEVWTWGANWNGRLGDGTQATRFTPARVRRTATANDYLTGVVSIAAAGGTMAAIDADMAVWTWGAGSNGTLGNGSTADSAYPVQVVAAGVNGASTPLLGVTQVACGSSGFCIALVRYGQVYGWGSNDLSQMGIAPGGAFSVAMPIFAGPNGGLDAIAAGAAHCIVHNALDDNVYGWGYNGRGQLGAGYASVAQFPPVAMGSGPNGMNNVTQLAAAGDSSLMVRYVDRAVFAAGDNQSGQLAVSSDQQALYLPVSTSLVR